MIQYKAFIDSLKFNNIITEKVISDETGDTIILKLLNTSCNSTPGHLHCLLNIVESLQEHVYNLLKIIQIDIRIIEWADYDDYSIVRLFICSEEFKK